MSTRSFLERIRRNFRRPSVSRKNRPLRSAPLVIPSERLEQRQLLTVNFNFLWEGTIGPNGVGFEDNNQGQARRDALIDVASQLGSQIVNTATVDISVTSFEDPNSGVLASAGSAVATTTQTFGGRQVVRNKIITGTDLNGANPDGVVNVNWGQNYEISPNQGDIDNTEFDFYAVMVHELMHAIGFASGVTQAGSSAGVAAGQVTQFNKFDEFLADAAGTRVISAGGILDLNQWSTLSVGGNSASGNGMFFAGPNAMAANNNAPVGLYSPNVWNGGSSISHIDTDNPAYNGFVMNHAVAPGAATRSLMPIEQGILTDLGYTLAGNIGQFKVTETDGDTRVSDSGTSDTFEVVLESRPIGGDVVIDLSIADATEVTSTTTTLTFTTNNWDVPQIVTVTGLTDGVPDGGQVTAVTLSVDPALSDSAFAFAADQTVNVISIDDDGNAIGKPVLLTPKGTIVGSNPNFTWTADANAETFELTIFDAAGVQVQRFSGLTNKNHTTFLPDGIYSAVVQAFNSNNSASMVSDPIFFGIGNTTPAAPRVVSPQQNDVLTISNPTFTWTQATNASSYELEVQTAGGTFRATVTTTSHTFATSFAEGNATVRVRGINAFGDVGAWSGAVGFVVDTVPAPTRPVITSPLVDETTETFPQFAWEATGASTYTVWVSQRDQTTGALTRVIYKTNHSNKNYRHFKALGNGEYIVWVQAFNKIGERSAWSISERFFIKAVVPGTTTIAEVNDPTTDTTPLLEWTAVPHAVRYDLWMNSRTTGQSQVVRVTDIRDNFYQLEQLPQGTYRAWVRAFNGNNEGGQWSAFEEFTIDILPPSENVLTGPVAADGSQLIDTAMPTFQWSVSERATTYQLWVNYDTGSVTKIIFEDDIIGRSFTPDGNIPQGDYRAWVRGKNEAGEVGRWSPAFAFTVDVPVPDRPVFTGPKPNPVGSVEDPTPTLTWTGLVQDVTYDLWINDDTAGISQVIRETELEGLEYTVPDDMILAEHTYTAWIRGKNTEGEFTKWSDAFTFRIDIPNPSTPRPVAPVGTVSAQPQYEWTHQSNTVRYQILVRDETRNQEVVLNVDTFQIDPIARTALFRSPTVLQRGTYRFWVRGFNTLGTSSNWSTSLSFVVASTTAKDIREPEFDGDSLTIQLTSLDRVEVEEVPRHVPVPVVTQADPETDTKRTTLTETMTSDVTSQPGTFAEDDKADSLIETVMAELADPAGMMAGDLEVLQQS